MTTVVSGTFEHQGQKYAMDKYPAAATPGKPPVVVVLHGTDGMGGESGSGIRTFAAQIAAEGFAVFVPHYFGADDGADTDPIAELFARRVPRIGNYGPRVAAAMKDVAAQTDVDGGRVGLVGLSLGGGLALEYAESARSGAVDALVDFFGFVSDPAIYANAARLPPTLVFHNAHDGIVDPQYSKKLVDALTKSGVALDQRFYTDESYPERKNHPFKPGGRADIESRAKTVAWLKKYLKASA
jgi:dienelactone hydrolase